jgi:hypothetical protein
MIKAIVYSLLLFVFIINNLYSQIPQTINYQGVLKDNNGVLVNSSQALTFKLYETETNGSIVWTESQTVDVKDGVFNVILGKATPLNVLFDKPYWLGISINGTELEPRIELTSSAYSLNAKTVEDSSITTEKIVDGAVTQDKLAVGVNLPPGGTAGGDLTGSYPNPTIKSNSINSSKIANGSVGTEDISDGAITEAKLSSGLSIPPGGTAGGDLSGSFPNPTVNKIRGRSVTNTAPTNGQVLKWNGINWEPSDIPTSGWEQNGSSLYPMTLSNNIGIGTNNPSRKLHVKGLGDIVKIESTNSDALITINNDGGYKGYMGIFIGDNDIDIGTGEGNTTGNLNLVTKNIPRVTVSPEGDVDIKNGELNRTSTGSANLLPIAFGKVDSDGSIISGSGNFSCVYHGLDIHDISAPKYYEININSEYYNNNFCTIINSSVANILCYSEPSSDGKLLIKNNNPGGGVGFSFVVYKP